MSRLSYENARCLVTGASAGIGREIALLLADRGARLVLTARRTDRLEGVANACRDRGAPVAEVVPADLAASDAADHAYDAACEALGAVDVLINNAGFSVPGVFVRSDIARSQAMLAVNMTSAFQLMRRALPPMWRRGTGGVLTVASVAGMQCAPYQAGYAGTKAFLLNLSNSVHQEMKGSGVAVTVLCPGVTDTEFFDAAGYRDLPGFMNRRMSAEKVARAGLRGLSRGRMEVVPGLTNKALVFVQRFVPRTFAAAVSRRLMGARPLPSRSGSGPSPDNRTSR